MLNLPYQSIGSLGFVVNISSCDIWYLYEFENATAETMKFWGSNTGSPIYVPNADGLLDGSGIMQTACPEIGWASPYFNQTSEGETINEYIYKTVELLNEEKINFKDRNSEVPNLHLLPDGAFKVKEASNQSLRYNLQINDNWYFQYHWNNGITKVGLNFFSNTTGVYLWPIEG